MKIAAQIFAPRFNSRCASLNFCVNFSSWNYKNVDNLFEGPPASPFTPPHPLSFCATFDKVVYYDFFKLKYKNIVY